MAGAKLFKLKDYGITGREGYISDSYSFCFSITVK